MCCLLSQIEGKGEREGNLCLLTHRASEVGNSTLIVVVVAVLVQCTRVLLILFMLCLLS